MSSTARKGKPALMAHIIPYYPDYSQSLYAAQRIVEAGAGMLELQFPFSDPTADGPSIQTACYQALEQGFTVKRGFAFLAALPEKAQKFVMTYANIVYTVGIKQFIQRCVECSVTGLIVPDMPVDNDEGLFESCRQAGLACVAVTLSSAAEDRIALICSKKPRYIYVSLRSGVTGTYTELEKNNLQFLQTLRSSGIQTIAGFGIRKPEQIRTLASYTDIVVLGSAIVEQLRDTGAESPAFGNFLKTIMQECAIH